MSINARRRCVCWAPRRQITRLVTSALVIPFQPPIPVFLSPQIYSAIMQLSLATSALRTNAVACRTSKPARRSLCVVRASVETEEKPAEAQAAPSTSQPSAPPSLVRPHKALTKSTLPDVMGELTNKFGSAPALLAGGNAVSSRRRQNGRRCRLQTSNASCPSLLSRRRDELQRLCS